MLLHEDRASFDKLRMRRRGEWHHPRCHKNLPHPERSRGTHNAHAAFRIERAGRQSTSITLRNAQ